MLNVRNKLPLTPDPNETNPRRQQNSKQNNLTYNLK